jgi:hypothetical protein
MNLIVKAIGSFPEHEPKFCVQSDSLTSKLNIFLVSVLTIILILTISDRPKPSFKSKLKDRTCRTLIDPRTEINTETENFRSFTMIHPDLES